MACVSVTGPAGNSGRGGVVQCNGWRCLSPGDGAGVLAGWCGVRVALQARRVGSVGEQRKEKEREH